MVTAIGNVAKPETLRNNGDPMDTHTEVPTSRSLLITNKDGIPTFQISINNLLATALASFKKIPFLMVRPITVLLVESLTTLKPWDSPTKDGLDKTLVFKDSKPPMSGETLDQRLPGEKLQTHNHQRSLSLREKQNLGAKEETATFLMDKPTTVLKLDLLSTRIPWIGPTKNGLNKKLMSMDKLRTINGEQSKMTEKSQNIRI